MKLRYFCFLFFISLNTLNARTITPTITINETIDQIWVNNHPGPWTISEGVTVTFAENLTITSTTQYFVITNRNVTIDGARHTVTLNGVLLFRGLVNASNVNAASAVIKNIGVANIGSSLDNENGYVSANYNKATITNCFNTGAINAYKFGGIAGSNNAGTISNCYNTGVISQNNAGGIVGSNNSASISNCYNTGNISGNESGGIAGYDNSGSISNCYSSGAISGEQSGGIAGSYNHASISNCYNTGVISFLSSGGIIGSPNAGSFLTSTFSENSGNWNIANANTYLLGTSGAGAIWDTSTTPYTLLPPPLINITFVTATLTSNCAGVPSAHTTFGVNGSGLTTPVIISAPSNFEVSTSSSGSYSSILTLPQASTVSQTLYIRLSSSATTNGANGTITANSSGLTPATTTVSSTTLAAPTFSVTGPYTICSEGTYAISLTVANSYNGWSTSSSTITVNNGYVTAGTTPGSYAVSYTDGCSQTASATVIVNNSDNDVAVVSGAQSSYKISNTSPIPQGPTASLYVGYNGFNYTCATKPTNTGYYKANNQLGNSAGCPYPFYIFRCTTCPD